MDAGVSPARVLACHSHDQRLDLAANRLRMPSKEPAFSVGEDKSPTTEARPEQPVLGFQLFDERFLLPGEPCSEHNNQELHQRRCLTHAGSVHRVAASRDQLNGGLNLSFVGDENIGGTPAAYRNVSGAGDNFGTGRLVLRLQIAVSPGG